MDNVLPEDCYVILHIGTGPSTIASKSAEQVVACNGRFALNRDTWIERLDVELAKHIQTACEPPNYRINNQEQDRHLYAFVRQVPHMEKSRYEGMDELFAVLALSRLIHPTSTGERYCARIMHFGSKDPAIKAISYIGISPDVFISGKHQDWLSVANAEDLRQLMPWVSKSKLMHSRVHRAYWFHEYAMRSYFLDARWVHVVSGLESLINVEEQRVALQFRSRVRQLAGEFHINLTDDELRQAYKLRSKLVHAENFLHGLENVLPKNQHLDLYEKLESVLGATVRRSLLDDNFGNFFCNDAAVQARWPL